MKQLSEENFEFAVHGCLESEIVKTKSGNSIQEFYIGMGIYRTTLAWKYFDSDGNVTGYYISPEYYHISNRNWEYLNDGLDSGN